MMAERVRHNVVRASVLYLLVEGVIGTVVLIKVIYITYTSNNVYKVVLRMILCICLPSKQVISYYT
jgi:hypothetical protein